MESELAGRADATPAADPHEVIRAIYDNSAIADDVMAALEAAGLQVVPATATNAPDGDDIVPFLRREAQSWRDNFGDPHVFDIAADEIERLRGVTADRYEPIDRVSWRPDEYSDEGGRIVSGLGSTWKPDATDEPVYRRVSP